MPIALGSIVNSLAQLFPESPRVFYERAPLTQVICQFRYPSVLRIDSQPPADFQDRIRDRFPLLERVQNQIPADLPPELIQAMGLATAAGNYSFISEDRISTLNLAADALSLVTTSYTTWEDFCALLMPALDALVEIYAPSFFQRVGLRYVNLINRSSLGLEGMSWRELLRPEVLGELSVIEIEAFATEYARNIRVKAPGDGCGLFFQHGLSKKKTTNELGYRLDFDFYRDEKTETKDAKSTVHSLNSMVGRAFRWCITSTLHESLGPSADRLVRHYS
jgi:uncharacterized protein (TIGR04255 family)